MGATSIAALVGSVAALWGAMGALPPLTGAPRAPETTPAAQLARAAGGEAAEATATTGAQEPGGAAGAGSAPGAAPGIVLIVIDALRADHLGAYGYERPTSPSIDRLASGSVLFENAIASSSWTLPSVASILTSTYPGQHGAVDKGDVLARDLDDLAGRMRAAGYRTAAFTTNPWLKRALGFDDGFEAYYDIDRLGLARSLTGVRLKNLALRRLARIRLDPELVPKAADVTARAEAWLAGNASAPFFLYLHYMDVHGPYDPVKPFHGRFCRGHRFDLPDHLLESRFRSGKHPGDAAVLEHVLELYDEDILATDAAIGRLLDALDASGLRGRTAVVLVADHGEEFYDHGDLTHGRNLHRETVRVPLIVSPAGGAPEGGRRVAERVSTLDVYPTILAMAGAAIPDHLEGRSLAPCLDGTEQAPPPRPIGTQLVYHGRASMALYVGEDKVIRTRPPVTDPSGRSAIELYRLEGDPLEKVDAAGAETERVAGLVSILDGLERVWGVAGVTGRKPGTKMDPETLKQLKALGYIN